MPSVLALKTSAPIACSLSISINKHNWPVIVVWIINSGAYNALYMLPSFPKLPLTTIFSVSASILLPFFFARSRRVTMF